MAIEPQTYITIWMTAVQAALSDQVDPVTAAELCHFAAQPETEAVVIDILDELKAGLYDWIPSDLNALKEAHIIQITGVHRDGTTGIKCAQVASLATERGWHGGMVHASRVNINVVMDTISARHLPEGASENLIRHSADIDWTGTGAKFNEAVEREVENFRKSLDEELNFLFPGNEEGGKS
jgi:hypothetical protein